MVWSRGAGILLLLEVSCELINFGALEAFLLIMVSVRVAYLSILVLYSCKICLYNSAILAVILLPDILLWRSNKMPAASCAQPKSTTCYQSKRRIDRKIKLSEQLQSQQHPLASLWDGMPVFDVQVCCRGCYACNSFSSQAWR